jgi:mannose PTS system EIIA component
MSVGLLLITHSGIAEALIKVAVGTFGILPLHVTYIAVPMDPDPEELRQKSNSLIKKLDTGQGVLVLTDIFGSTPSNIAQDLQRHSSCIRVVSGLNLPMLFRILNYPHLPLHQMADKAVSGGKTGIFEPMIEAPLVKNNNVSQGLKKYPFVMEI